jgi:hypothetical protein
MPLKRQSRPETNLESRCEAFTHAIGPLIEMSNRRLSDHDPPL